MFKTDYQAVRNDLEFLNSSGKRLNNSSCSLQNTIKSSPNTFRTAKNFKAPLSARMARPLNWGQSESGLFTLELKLSNGSQGIIIR